MSRNLGEWHERGSALVGNILTFFNDTKKCSSRRENQFVKVGHHILCALCSNINWESGYVVNLATTEYGPPSGNIGIAFYDAKYLITLFKNENAFVSIIHVYDEDFIEHNNPILVVHDYNFP